MSIPVESHAIIANQPLPLDQQPAAVYIASLASANSRRNMERHLNRVAVLLGAVENERPCLQIDWSRVRFQHVTAIRTRMMADYGASTVNMALSAVRGVLRTAWKLGQMSADDYRRAVDVPNIKAERLPAGRDLKHREIRALLDDCERGRRKDVRDAAIIALLYVTGMRRSEIVGLERADYYGESGKITIRGGKGNKDRVVYVKNRPQVLLEAWLAVRGDHAGPLFQAVNKGDVVLVERGLSAQAVYNMLKKRGKAVGLVDFSPHDLRRTFVGDALDAGIDLATVADIAGHASTDTTRRYDRRGERAKEKAASVLDV